MYKKIETVEGALKAAKEAEREGLSGMYPAALIVLAKHVESAQSYGELNKKAIEAVGAMRSVNRSGHHKITIEGDDQPCYWQREEWISYLLDMAFDLELATNIMPDAYIQEKTADVLLNGGTACDVLFTPEQTERNRVGILIHRGNV